MPENPHAHLARAGFKISEVRTEQHEFPARAAAPNSPPPQSATPKRLTQPQPQPAPVKQMQTLKPTPSPKPTGLPKGKTTSLPPGHPLAAKLAQQQPQEARPVPTVAPIQTPSDPSFRPQSETDPTYMSVGLPSLKHFYPYRDLSVCTMKGYHQAKFFRSTREDNLRYLVEAMSSTIGDGVSAFDLVPADFYFLMYWHRVSSFTKNPQILKLECTDQDHIRQTLLPEDDPNYLPPDTLKIEAFLDKTSLDTEYLEAWDPSPWAELHEKYTLGVETMRDLVEFGEERDELMLQQGKMTEDQLAEQLISEDEFMWMTARASFLARIEGRSTLRERIETIKMMDADEIQSLEEYMAAATDFGVKEYANLTCKECGAHHRALVSIDALNFLPKNR
jgi:hypothetical protein